MGDRILTPTPFGNVHKKSNKTIFGHLVKTIPRATRKLTRTYLKTAAAPSLKRQANHVSQMAHKPISLLNPNDTLYDDGLVSEYWYK